MLVVLAVVQDNADIWKKIFGFSYDVIMMIFDLIWNTKLPLTDITLAYWIIFWMVVKLSVFAINGTSSGYNQLGSTVSNAYSSSVKSVKNFKTARSKKRKEKQKAKSKETKDD